MAKRLILYMRYPFKKCLETDWYHGHIILIQVLVPDLVFIYNIGSCFSVVLQVERSMGNLCVELCGSELVHHCSVCRKKGCLFSKKIKKNKVLSSFISYCNKHYTPEYEFGSPETLMTYPYTIILHQCQWIILIVFFFFFSQIRFLSSMILMAD